ncbi:MAG: hotdog fold thioesterase [Bacteroidia bacterium]
MSIWKNKPTLQEANERGKGTMNDYLGIKFTEIGDDYLVATMPVNQMTIQPAGILHGGANVTLAETLGSVAATLCVDEKEFMCVGLEINANHLKSVSSGVVKGVTKPIHIGRSTQVWEIKIYDEKENLTCISRITMAVLNRRKI